MINIIQHLWQYEVQHCLIVPTAIKIGNNPVKTYFYSEKQGRVLRKKQHTAQMVVQVMKMKQIPGQQFLVLFVENNREVVPKMMLENEVMELVETSSTNCAVIGLQGDTKIQLIYECKLTPKKFKTLTLLELKQGKWTSIGEQINQNVHNKLNKECVGWLDKLLKKLAVADKWIDFQFMVGTDSNYEKFYCLWSNKLQWKNHTFYQILYNYSQQTQVIKNVPACLNFGSISLELQSVKQEKSIEEPLFSWQQQQNSNLKQCKGCGKLAQVSSLLELSNEDVIKIRRMHKLSIMGINQQFQEVCPQCCEMADSF